MRTTGLTLSILNVCTGLASAVVPQIPASCPQILPAPAPSSLPTYFPPKAIPSSKLPDIETIRQTLHFYALVLDTKTFPQLDRVFASGATANYTGLAGEVQGLPAIESFLSNQLAPYPLTQHLIGNHIIDVCADNWAVSQTYFSATHFPPNGTEGLSIFTAYVNHQDVWERAQNGWRIVYSNFAIIVSRTSATREEIWDTNVDLGSSLRAVGGGFGVFARLERIDVRGRRIVIVKRCCALGGLWALILRCRLWARAAIVFCRDLAGT